MPLRGFFLVLYRVELSLVKVLEVLDVNLKAGAESGFKVGGFSLPGYDLCICTTKIAVEHNVARVGAEELPDIGKLHLRARRLERFTALVVTASAIATSALVRLGSSVFAV